MTFRRGWNWEGGGGVQNRPSGVEQCRVCSQFGMLGSRYAVDGVLVGQAGKWLLGVHLDLFCVVASLFLKILIRLVFGKEPGKYGCDF